jgi:hypothetical protein
MGAGGQVLSAGQVLLFPWCRSVEWHIGRVLGIPGC